MSEAMVFDCEPRKRTGTGGSRAVRRDGWVPAVLYGGDEAPLNIKLRYNQVLKAYQSGRLIDVLAKIDLDGKQHQVVGRDIQVDVVKDLPMHVDLMRVDAKTRMTVNVPVRFINDETCPGLKQGGVLNVVRHEVELIAPATAIPEALTVDLAEAELGDSLHISAVKLPANVELTITDRDFTIATIATPSGLRSQEAAEGEEEAEAAAEGEEAPEGEEAEEQSEE